LEQKGRIFEALLDFPEQPEFEDQMLVMAWDFMADALEENDKKWDEMREKRSAAGRKGAEATNVKRQQNAANTANADFAGQKQQNAANTAVSVNVNGNDTVNAISPNGGVYNSAAPAAVDVELSKIVQHYQQAVGDFPRSALDKLQKWRQEYSTEMILLAIDKAAEAGKRSWNYINGILSGWQRDGIQTPGDVLANEQNRQNRPNRKQPAETVDDQLARVLAKMDRERGFET
jgi:DnaD/phage-associated family protein